MLAPLSWLGDYAPFASVPVDHLVTALSDLGLVVEGTTYVGADLPGVVVAEILAIRTHPNADKIRLVDVDAGRGEPLQIACGAWNMAVGDLVPLAAVGALLPGATEPITRRKMRGEWSNGMLCSPTEIGQPDIEGVDGLLILPPDLAKPGTPIGEALGGVDVVFDLDVAPNRPDALCMAGIARDLAAVLGLAWAWPAGVPGAGPATGAASGAGAPPASGPQGASTAARADPTVGRAQIVVDDADLCARFNATVITGIAVGASPPWLVRRLTLAGMRAINSVVDVSNYVMLDVGQPNHAYDLDRLGGRGLLVRRAHAGETLVTLDGVTRSFDGDDLLICDAESVPVGVAGIMGGASAEISAATTTVLLEAAWFDPFAVARTGTRLGLGSEARHRFERGVDPEIASRAATRFIQVLDAVTAAPAPAEPAGGEGGASAVGSIRFGPSVDVRSDADLPVPARLEVRTERVNALLGTDLDAATIATLLTSIGFEVHRVGAGPMDVVVPSWRPDTQREVDVIEEVARLYGYRNIPRRVPRPPGRGGLDAFQLFRRRVRSVLVGAGLDEAWTTTFLAPGDLQRAGLDEAAVTVTNPLDASESVLRTELLPGLLKSVRLNADRQQPDVRLFEIGRVFARPDGTAVVPREREDLAVIVAGAGADAPLAVRLWTVLDRALALVGVSLEAAEVAGLHPTRSARIVGGDGTALGEVGEVDPDVSAAYGLAGRVGYFRVDLVAVSAQPTRVFKARAVSRFPASDVDLAFVVPDEVPAAAVAATLRASVGAGLEDLDLFDVFRGDQLDAGRRSLAWRLRLRSGERTLTDVDLATIRQAAIDAVIAAHGARLRA
jgi:phenylalanyl-tRNA synthetase beta chain